MKKNDIFLGIYLLAAVVFLIIPIPSTMLDWLILFNISMSLIIVFNCLFTSETLNMSGFPTLLLFTTVFRISLNVSSTRLILSTGNPGKVVQVFGPFVGGGNLVIGAIVFIVLIIVQMMVINKGSERVSEVTARFTLDAMPGNRWRLMRIFHPEPLMTKRQSAGEIRSSRNPHSSEPWMVRQSTLKEMQPQV